VRLPEYITAVIALPSRVLAVWTYVMTARPRYAGAGARTQQTGMVVALALLPATFQRTLMPRSTLDQALATGICGALDFGFAALIQDTVEAIALRISGATSPEQADRRTWRRASIAADLAAIALGLAGQTACRPRSGERVPRGALRTIWWWISATGLCGTMPSDVRNDTCRSLTSSRATQLAFHASLGGQLPGLLSQTFAGSKFRNGIMYTALCTYGACSASCSGSVIG
jgi:hypothetical protein